MDFIKGFDTAIFIDIAILQGAQLNMAVFFWYLVKSVTSKMSSIIELYYPNKKLRCRVLEKLPRLIVVVGQSALVFRTNTKKLKN